MTRDSRAPWRDADPDDRAAMEMLGRPGSSCPAPDLIQASGTGTLAPQLEARVAAHVARCGTCQALVATLDDPAVIDLTADERQRILERVRAGIDDATRTASPRGWRRAAAMVTVGVAAAGALLFWQLRQPSTVTVPFDTQFSAVSRLSGVVTSVTGEPLEGAIVGAYLLRREGDHAVFYRSRFQGATDGAGRYSVSGTPESQGSGLNLRASKPGYFSALTSIPISPEMRADFRLTPWTHVALDDVVRGTVTAGDGRCGGLAEPCRQFVVSVPRTGTLEMALATSVRADLDLWVETPLGDVYSPPMALPLRLAVPVFAGAVCQITVVNNGNGPRDFELTMRLR